MPRKLKRTEPLDERFQVHIGRADGGRSFVRVVDLRTGNSRTQVGFDGETADSVARQLAAEIDADFGTRPLDED